MTIVLICKSRKNVILDTISPLFDTTWKLMRKYFKIWKKAATEDCVHDSAETQIQNSVIIRAHSKPRKQKRRIRDSHWIGKAVVCAKTASFETGRRCRYCNPASFVGQMASLTNEALQVKTTDLRCVSRRTYVVFTRTASNEFRPILRAWEHGL